MYLSLSWWITEPSLALLILKRKRGNDPKKKMGGNGATFINGLMGIGEFNLSCGSVKTAFRYISG